MAPRPDDHPVHQRARHRPGPESRVDHQQQQAALDHRTRRVGGKIGWLINTAGHELKGLRANGASLYGIQVVGPTTRWPGTPSAGTSGPPIAPGSESRATATTCGAGPSRATRATACRSSAAPIASRAPRWRAIPATASHQWNEQYDQGQQGEQERGRRLPDDGDGHREQVPEQYEQRVVFGWIEGEHGPRVQVRSAGSEPGQQQG